MDVFRKNPIDDAISVKSIVSVWRFKLSEFGNPIGDLHDFHEMVFVEEGAFCVVVDGEEFRIEEGECYLYPPLAYHIAAEKRERSVIRIISFESDSECLKQIERTPIKMSDTARDFFMMANKIGLESFFYPDTKDGVRGMKLCENANPYSVQKMKKCLEISLIELLSERGAISIERKNSKNFKNERASSLTEFFRMNLSRQLALSEMAEAISVSISTLKSLSKEAFGMPPLAYFLSLKLESAKKMMRESPYTFTEISERLGFSSVHYFSRLFKQHTGMTPSEYAKG